MHTSRPILLLATVTLVISATGDAEAGRAKPVRLSNARLLSLIRGALAPKASIARLAKKLDRRMRRAEALPFVVEPTDELHPALSTPWDLPRAEYPRRAVLRFGARAFGKPAELRLVAPLAALKDATRAAVARAEDSNIVLMITAPRRGRELPLKAVERLLRRLGCSVYASGELGNCKPAKEWCETRRYAIPAKGRRREGTLMLELGGGGVGGLKLIAKPAR